MPTALTGVVAKLERLPRDFVEGAVERFDLLAKESASRIVGGGATMHLHGRKGRRPAVKLKTRSRIYGQGATATAYVSGTPKGPWVWIEDGTQAHEIGRRRGRGGGTVTFLHGPFYEHPIRGPIMHHGSRGQGAWTRAVDEFSREFPKFAARRLKEIVTRAQ